MATSFEQPSWLTTQTPWSGSDAFIKGSQVGSAIAANRLRAKQLYVEVQQNQQRMDLAERQFAVENESATLRNEVARTKMANDAADFEALRKWYPEFLTSDGDMAPPILYNENAMLKVSSEIATKRSKVGMAAFAAFMAEPGRDLNRPEDRVEYYNLLAKYQNIPDKLGPDGIMAPIKMAETLKRLRDEANSRISERDRKADMAGNIGWVYPEDGSPPYLVDAKGGTKFAPFHTGIDADFTPEKTTIGGVDLIHVSPNKWQVVNRPQPEGKMTDLEKEDLRDIRKKRQALIDLLPSEVPKLGMFGGNKSAFERYTKETNQIAELTAKEDALRAKVEGRSKPAEDQPRTPRAGLQTNAPPVVVPQPIAPKVITKEEYDKLSPGTKYTAPDGSTRTKG